MKKNADLHQIPHSFKLGDQVLVRLRPYRQTSVAGQRVQKLSQCFYGPFPIKKCIGEVVFELELPKESKIHPVFHASKLKPFHGDIDNKELALPSAFVENQPKLKPLAIVASKVEGDPLQELVLVQWDGLFSEDSTWESLDQLLADFLELHLVDKVFFHRDGNDMGQGQEEEIEMGSNPNEELVDQYSQHVKPKRKGEQPNWMKDYVVNNPKRNNNKSIRK